jgi:hypothetical protein
MDIYDNYHITIKADHNLDYAFIFVVIKTI